MRNIKARYIWISVAVSFVIAIGLILGLTQMDGVWQNVGITLLAITFIYMTIAIQIASTKTFRYKAKNVKYPTIDYRLKDKELEELLKKKGYKPRVTPFGAIYLKISGTYAYRVCLIRDFEKYFNQEENQQEGPANRALEKCKKFMGFEIFYSYDEDVLRKLPDFSLQGNNIYYSGFYLEDSILKCLNYVEPNEAFAKMYQQLKEDLELEDALGEDA